MIKINKAETSSNEEWNLKSKNITSVLCNTYNKDRDSYKSDNNKPKSKLDFPPHYKGVKRELQSVQHNKCCYCESKIIEQNAHHDVEHFRPKVSFRNEKDSGKKSRTYPGYYWLAYDWNNLFYSCKICNETKKNDIFPVKDPAARKRECDDGKDIKNETALLIDPSSDDPEKHIKFSLEYIYGETDEGKMTINIIGLDRKELNNARRELFLRILDELSLLRRNERAYKIANDPLIKNTLHSNIQFLQKKLINYYKDSSEFAGMVRSNFPNLYFPSINSKKLSPAT